MVRRGSDPTVAADIANILQLHEAANSAVRGENAEYNVIARLDIFVSLCTAEIKHHCAADKAVGTKE